MLLLGDPRILKYPKRVGSRENVAAAGGVRSVLVFQRGARPRTGAPVPYAMHAGNGQAQT
jgi:hypothetical protein